MFVPLRGVVMFVPLRGVVMFVPLRGNLPRVLPWILLWAALGVAGCGDAPPGSLRPVLRFLDRPVQRPFRPADLASDEVVFDWRLRDLELVAERGTSLDPYTLEIAGRTTEVRMVGKRLEIDRPVDFDATAIDRLDVVLGSRRTGSTATGDVTILWAAPGEGFDSTRGLEVAGGEQVAEDLRLYQIALRRHPGWTGRIGRLRLAISIALQGQISVRRITGYRELVTPEKLEALRRDGLEVRLGGQIRDALPALPGLPIERRLIVPEGAELRFAYGTQVAVAGTVRLAVTVITEESEKRRIFEVAVVPDGTPGAHASGRWHDGTVSLAAFAGQQVTFRLEASADQTLDPRQGFALWGHPEVLAPGRAAPSP